jgi:hypothetical protein
VTSDYFRREGLGNKSGLEVHFHKYFIEVISGPNNAAAMDSDLIKTFLLRLDKRRCPDVVVERRLFEFPA